MCGRFSLIATWQSLLDAMKAEPPKQYTARYNIAPSQPVLLLWRNEDTGRREFTHALWGLVPSWSNEDRPVNPLINARAETAATKPAFRESFRRRRCLIPATGFYEWSGTGGKKQPWHFQMRDGGLFAFAGLWERLVSPVGGEIETCAILTTTANRLVAKVHDRMPCILQPEAFDAWIGDGEETPGSAQTTAVQKLLRPFPDLAMRSIAVATGVNSPAVDGPACLEPARRERGVTPRLPFMDEE
ncbi:MAG TPA: SOS response-associated peptidase [Candidatus Ozemobacteraceae bacterium]|nr:SOS response-associated peptidase [Candidatus Ozemobacteraceae bacterium]